MAGVARDLSYRRSICCAWVPVTPEQHASHPSHTCKRGEGMEEHTPSALARHSPSHLPAPHLAPAWRAARPPTIPMLAGRSRVKGPCVAVLGRRGGAAGGGDPGGRRHHHGGRSQGSPATRGGPPEGPPRRGVRGDQPPAALLRGGGDHGAEDHGGLHRARRHAQPPLRGAPPPLACLPAATGRLVGPCGSMQLRRRLGRRCRVRAPASLCCCAGLDNGCAPLFCSMACWRCPVPS
jgi:hypothetical protein